MPRFEAPNSALARTSSSCSTPTVANTGWAWEELAVGLELCAATQMEQEEACERLGWLWVDSAAAVHNIRDRQSQADHRNQRRMNFPLRAWIHFTL
jgi:hypothetical protein